MIKNGEQTITKYGKRRRKHQNISIIMYLPKLHHYSREFCAYTTKTFRNVWIHCLMFIYFRFVAVSRAYPAAPHRWSPAPATDITCDSVLCTGAVSTAIFDALAANCSLHLLRPCWKSDHDRHWFVIHEHPTVVLNWNSSWLCHMGGLVYDSRKGSTPQVLKERIFCRRQELQQRRFVVEELECSKLAERACRKVLIFVAVHSHEKFSSLSDYDVR